MGAMIQAKISALLDRSADPSESLDYAYQKQLEALHKVKRGVVEVVTSKRRLEMQAAKLEESVHRLDDQARRALAAGREDLARLALERKQVALAQAEGLRAQISALEQEQEKLTLAEQKLTAKVESFRTRKEVIKAQYSAAEAQNRINETITGLSEEMADVSLMVERAEEKTQTLRARASAIDELMESGVLEEVGGPRGDLIDRELGKLSAQQNVEAELADLKRQFQLEKKDPKQLEGRS